MENYSSKRNSKPNKGMYNLTRRVRREAVQRNLERTELEEGIIGKKREITEREYDQMMRGSINGQIQTLQELETNISQAIRMYQNKDLAQNYPEIRLRYFQDDETVWCEEIPRRVGFVKD